MEDTVLDKAKEQMADALKIHNTALEYSNHPDYTIQHAQWRQKAGNKLKRAKIFYRKKREALVNAYGVAGLPTEADSLYPPLL